MSGGITFSGMASGMDTASIVEALMQVEKQPLNRLQKRQTINNERLEAYSSFNDKLKGLLSIAEKLADEEKIHATKSTLSDEKTLSIESNSEETMEGNYNIVVKQLSQVQKNVSAGFDSKSKPILGEGTLSFDLLDENGAVSETVTFEVTDKNNSLKELAETINAQSEETGIAATIIDDGKDSGNYHLVFSGTDSGSRFTVGSNLSGAAAGVDADFNGSKTTQTQQAQQAVAYVDGVEIVSNSNTLEGAVPGVDITLSAVSKIADENAADPMQKYAATRLSVEPDNGAMKEKIKSFVDSYNGIMEYLKKGTDDDSSMNSYLRTDSTVRNLKSNMQKLLSETFGGEKNGEMIMLSQAGISTQQDGTLEISNSKLDKALDEHYSDFVKMFAGTEKTDGVMDKFKSLMDDATDSVDGLYAAKKESHDSLDRTLNNRIAAMESRLEKREEAYNAQFSAMESLISSWNSQASFLTSALLANA